MCSKPMYFDQQNPIKMLVVSQTNVNIDLRNTLISIMVTFARNQEYFNLGIYKYINCVAKQTTKSSIKHVTWASQNNKKYKWNLIYIMLICA